MGDGKRGGRSRGRWAGWPSAPLSSATIAATAQPQGRFSSRASQRTLREVLVTPPRQVGPWLASGAWLPAALHLQFPFLLSLAPLPWLGFWWQQPGAVGQAREGGRLEEQGQTAPRPWKLYNFQRWLVMGATPHRAVLPVAAQCHHGQWEAHRLPSSSTFRLQGLARPQQGVQGRDHRAPGHLTRGPGGKAALFAHVQSSG